MAEDYIKQIFEYLARHPHSTRADVMEALDLPEDDASMGLCYLVQQDLIVQTGSRSYEFGRIPMYAVSMNNNKVNHGRG